VTTGITAVQVVRKATTMLTCIKVVGMTSCAGARIVKPEGNILVIIGVARNTRHTRIVVTWIIAIVRMSVTNRRPTVGGMAGIAIRRRYKMIPPLTGCRATVVA